MKTLIGYQGDIGSNAEAAAEELVRALGLKSGECEFVPLIDSESVARALKDGTIKYGVMATKNLIAGEVLETKLALKKGGLKEVGAVTLPIHHCIFCKPGADVAKLEYITSHPQALKQTRKTRGKLGLKLKETEYRDTAIAARDLSEGKLSENHAVICRKNAGELYGLKLLYENIEDDKNNRTEFKLFEF